MALLSTLLLALVPVTFPARPGWYTGRAPAHACPGVSVRRCVQAESWASTTPFRDCAGCFPHRTLARLPRDGVVIQLTLAVEHPTVLRRALRRPLTIRASEVSGPFEGAPARIGVFQTSGRIGRYELLAIVFFGRLRPTTRQLAAANAELRAAHLP